MTTRIPQEQYGNYDEAVRLLARACMARFPDADSHDVSDALSHSIAENMPRGVQPLLLAIRITQKSGWPMSQYDADAFLGRYVREYELLSSAGRRKGLQGLDIVPLEMLASSFPPRTCHDEIRHEQQKSAYCSRPTMCMELIEESYTGRSPLFESVRMVLARGTSERIVAYLASFVRYMVESGHSDDQVAMRLKASLNSARTAQLTSQQ